MNSDSDSDSEKETTMKHTDETKRPRTGLENLGLSASNSLHLMYT